MLKEEYKSAILQSVACSFPTAHIYFYDAQSISGKVDSGIVIGVDTGAQIDFNELARAYRILDVLNIPVVIDLVDMHIISEDLKVSILLKGILWKN